MASNCGICQCSCIFKRRPNTREGEIFGTSCDGCKIFICKECANLSTTETDALLLQNRTVIFFCSDCRSNSPGSQPFLVQQYDLLKATLVQKDNYISTLEIDFEDLKTNLKCEIDRLCKDNKQKDVHIKRLERRTVTLDEEVFEAEKEYQNTISKQKNEINRLNEDFTMLSKRNDNFNKDINAYSAKIKSLEQQLFELNRLKLSFEASTTSLTESNSKLKNTIDELKSKISNKKGFAGIDFGVQTDNLSKLDFKNSRLKQN